MIAGLYKDGDCLPVSLKCNQQFELTSVGRAGAIAERYEEVDFAWPP